MSKVKGADRRWARVMGFVSCCPQKNSGAEADMVKGSAAGAGQSASRVPDVAPKSGRGVDERQITRTRLHALDHWRPVRDVGNDLGRTPPIAARRTTPCY